MENFWISDVSDHLSLVLVQTSSVRTWKRLDWIIFHFVHHLSEQNYESSFSTTRVKILRLGKAAGSLWRMFLLSFCILPICFGTVLRCNNGTRGRYRRKHIQSIIFIFLMSSPHIFNFKQKKSGFY